MIHLGKTLTFQRDESGLILFPFLGNQSLKQDNSVSMQQMLWDISYHKGEASEESLENLDIHPHLNRNI